MYWKVDDKVNDKVYDKVNEFDTFEPLTSTERLSTVSSHYIVYWKKHQGGFQDLRTVNFVFTGAQDFQAISLLMIRLSVHILVSCFLRKNAGLPSFAKVWSGFEFYKSTFFITLTKIIRHDFRKLSPSKIWKLKIVTVKCVLFFFHNLTFLGRDKGIFRTSMHRQILK